MGDNTEDVVMTAMKNNGKAMMRMERKRKKEINLKKVHHIGGGPYKGILVNKIADELDSVGPAEGRVEFMAYLINSDQRDESIQDLWTLRFWFRGYADGVTKKRTFTDYFAELISPGNLPRKYVGFVKRALVLLQKYTLIKRIELEVEQKEGSPDEDLPPIKSFVSVFTPDSYTYRFVPEVSVEGKTFITFKIKAPSDACLALCAVYGDVQRKTYEVALGAENNTKSYIRDGSLGVVKAEAKTVKLLSDQEFRYFWVSWNDHTVRVGRGAKKGHGRFLSWKVPPTRQFQVNSLAVATSRRGKGQWEFAEILDEGMMKKSKRANLQLSLLWLSKKQRMLWIMEDAYPNSVNVSTLFKACKVKNSDNMTAVVMMKEMEKRGLIKEVERGVWMRMQNKAEQTEHEVHLMKELPQLTGTETPTIGVITGLYAEKLAVDAMMDSKRTYVKYKTEAGGKHGTIGESQVYTVGRIGKRNVVSTKITKEGDEEADLIAAENTVTRLLGTFPQIEHVFMVGVGGAVPHYSDCNQHVRLGDVVVSVPTENDEATYIFCSKAEQIQNAKGYSYATRVFSPEDARLIKVVNQIRALAEPQPLGEKPWDKHIEAGKDILRGQESNFHRPMINRDKLFLTRADGKVIQCDHPRPSGMAARGYKEGQTQVRYGVIGSGNAVSTNEELRRDFAALNGIKAYHGEYDMVLESLEGNRNESFLVILGMCDYLDGSKKEWQSFAALAAAAYMKTVILAL